MTPQKTSAGDGRRHFEDQIEKESYFEGPLVGSGLVGSVSDFILVLDSVVVLPFLVVFFLAFFLVVAFLPGSLVSVVVDVLVDCEPVTGFVDFFVSDEDFVSVVCAKTPVGKASATARATNFNRDFFIFSLLSARGTTHRVTHSGGL